MREKEIEKRENERLEWLGDSILNFFVSQYLYEKFESEDEGKLTNHRKKLVSTEVLSKAGKGIGLKLERKNTKKYADMYETEVAKIFFSKGDYETKKFILKTLIKPFENLADNLIDYKSSLQEKLQINGKVEIEYKTIAEGNQFRCELYTNGKLLSFGTGKTKKAAEKKAAKFGLSGGVG